MLELSAIAFIDRLVDTKAIDRSRFRPLLPHGIDGGSKLGKLGASGKMNAGATAAARSMTRTGFQRGEPVHLRVGWNKAYSFLRLMLARWNR
jgi:hypothetical protein